MNARPTSLIINPYNDYGDYPPANITILDCSRNQIKEKFFLWQSARLQSLSNSSFVKEATGVELHYLSWH